MSIPFHDLQATINRSAKAEGIRSLEVGLLFEGSSQVEVFRVPDARFSYNVDPIGKLNLDILNVSQGRESKLAGYHVLARDDQGAELFHQDSDPAIPGEYHDNAVEAQPEPEPVVEEPAGEEEVDEGPSENEPA